MFVENSWTRKGRHFLRRGYPIESLEEVALLARRKDSDSLLSKVADTTTSEEEDNRFFITTFHPNDTSVKVIVFKNWEILGTSCTTTHIHQKKLIVVYRRPKYFRDVLIRAAIPPLAGDEKSNPNHKTPMMTEPVDMTTNPTTQGNILKMDQFLIKNEEHTRSSTETICQPTISTIQS